MKNVSLSFTSIVLSGLYHSSMAAYSNDQQQNLRGTTSNRNLQLTPGKVTVWTAPLPHKISALCWDGSEEDATSVYTGEICNSQDNSVLWNSIKTVDSLGNVVVGPDGLPCEWSRRSDDDEWNQQYLGSCGVVPEIGNTLVQPKHGQSTKFVQYQISGSTIHNDNLQDLCGPAAASIVHMRFDGGICPGQESVPLDQERQVQWNSMKAMDANGDLVNCGGDNSVAVWSRWSSDVMEMPTAEQTEWLDRYLGSCGLAPTEFPSLKITW